MRLELQGQAGPSGARGPHPAPPAGCGPPPVRSGRYRHRRGKPVPPDTARARPDTARPRLPMPHPPMSRPHMSRPPMSHPPMNIRTCPPADRSLPVPRLPLAGLRLPPLAARHPPLADRGHQDKAPHPPPPASRTRSPAPLAPPHPPGRPPAVGATRGTRSPPRHAPSALSGQICRPGLLANGIPAPQCRTCALCLQNTPGGEAAGRGGQRPPFRATPGRDPGCHPVPSRPVKGA